MPSDTTVLGLLRHLALAETIWFTELMAGGNRADLGPRDACRELRPGARRHRWQHWRGLLRGVRPLAAMP